MSGNYWRVDTECSLGYFMGILARLGEKLSNWAGAETGEKSFGVQQEVPFWLFNYRWVGGLGVRVQGVLIGWFYLIFVSFSD